MGVGKKKWRQSKVNHLFISDLHLPVLIMCLPNKLNRPNKQDKILFPLNDSTCIHEHAVVTGHIYRQKPFHG